MSSAPPAVAPATRDDRAAPAMSIVSGIDAAVIPMGLLAADFPLPRRAAAVSSRVFPGDRDHACARFDVFPIADRRFPIADSLTTGLPTGHRWVHQQEES